MIIVKKVDEEPKPVRLRLFLLQSLCVLGVLELLAYMDGYAYGHHCSVILIAGVLFVSARELFRRRNARK